MSDTLDASAFVPFIGIARHRLTIDGEGVTTLAAFHGCPLDCRFCLNPQCKGQEEACGIWHTPQTLYEELKVDELYFLATRGGVTFGGGEPLLYAGFIAEFRKCCGPQWRITLETSLNVPEELLQTAMPAVDSWIVDVKDMDESIYRRYTGCDNVYVVENLKVLADVSRTADCLIRLPEIPGYNTLDNVRRSEQRLRAMGFEKFDHFKYKTNGKRETDMQDIERDPSADSGGQ